MNDRIKIEKNGKEEWIEIIRYVNLADKTYILYTIEPSNDVNISRLSINKNAATLHDITPEEEKMVEEVVESIPAGKED